MGQARSQPGLILTVGAMAVTFLVILRLNGGGFEVVVAGYLAVQLAQVVLFAVLVMAQWQPSGS